MLQKLESFFIGGKYFHSLQGTRMVGQAYVQRRTPENVLQPYPLVLLHCGKQTAAYFETTPDGRPGWADYFVSAGFAVYLVDRPGSGRSIFLEEEYGKPGSPGTTEHSERNITRSESFNLWPNAELHNQWPGSGLKGDPIFDHHFASHVTGGTRRGIGDMDLQEQTERAVGAALLDRIGPAIVLTHSQSGLYGWHIGDARPALVKAIIAVEPVGPPFVGIATDPPEFYREGGVSKPYGITATPLTYDPPVKDPSVDLSFVDCTNPDDPQLVRSLLQTEPARKLVNLAQVPVAVVTGEASYHSNYDHCTVRYLRQAGVDVAHIRLGEIGIHGNSHMMMLEKNSDVIAEVISRWLMEHFSLE